MQFQSCDDSSYCTVLGENGCTDSLTSTARFVQLSDFCMLQQRSTAKCATHMDQTLWATVWLDDGATETMGNMNKTWVHTQRMYSWVWALIVSISSKYLVHTHFDKNKNILLHNSISSLKNQYRVTNKMQKHGSVAIPRQWRHLVSADMICLFTFILLINAIS